jgi:hypothetical protein
MLCFERVHRSLLFVYATDPSQGTVTVWRMSTPLSASVSQVRPTGKARTLLSTLNRYPHHTQRPAQYNANLDVLADGRYLYEASHQARQHGQRRQLDGQLKPRTRHHRKILCDSLLSGQLPAHSMLLGLARIGSLLVFQSPSPPILVDYCRRCYPGDPTKSLVFAGLVVI